MRLATGLANFLAISSAFSACFSCALKKLTKVVSERQVTKMIRDRICILLLLFFSRIEVLLLTVVYQLFVSVLYHYLNYQLLRHLSSENSANNIINCLFFVVVSVMSRKLWWEIICQKVQKLLSVIITTQTSYIIHFCKAGIFGKTANDLSIGWQCSLYRA